MGSCCLTVWPFLLAQAVPPESEAHAFTPLVAGSYPKFSPTRPLSLSDKEAWGCPAQGPLWSTFPWLTETASSMGAREARD